MTAPVLEMRGIRKTFPGVVALDGVELTLFAGEVHMLLGENGAGKSTLMKILSGAYRKDAGEIRINGATFDIGSPRDALDRGIRVIYQELNLVPNLSVAENIFLGALPSRTGAIVDWATLYDRTVALLRDLGMAIDARARVADLGLALRQMVEIAKALAGGDATVLVMDEPTSALTTREVAQLFGLIERLRSRGVAIVYITHRLDEVFRIGQRITVLRDGRYVATRSIDEVSVTGSAVRVRCRTSASLSTQARSSASRVCSVQGVPSWRASSPARIRMMKERSMSMAATFAFAVPPTRSPAASDCSRRIAKRTA
jgi:ribose transport system ATP-binding protein